MSRGSRFIFGSGLVHPFLEAARDPWARSDHIVVGLTNGFEDSRVTESLANARRAQRYGASAPVGRALRRETCSPAPWHLWCPLRQSVLAIGAQGAGVLSGLCYASLVVGRRLGWRSQGVEPMITGRSPRESRRRERSSSGTGGRRVGDASRSGTGDYEEVQSGAGVRGGTQARRSARVPLRDSSCTGTRVRGDGWPLAGAGCPPLGSLHCGDLEDPAKDNCVS